MKWDEKLKSFLDDRPNPFLQRYIVKTIKENNMDIKWSSKEDPKKYYPLCFKTIDNELNLRKGLEEYYLQWQVANELLESGTAEAEQIAGMMQRNGVFSLEYSRLIKKLGSTGQWDENEFEKIWNKSLKQV
jgi:hypothetical protein